MEVVQRKMWKNIVEPRKRKEEEEEEKNVVKNEMEKRGKIEEAKKDDSLLLLLARRYSLTKSDTKFIEIGILPDIEAKIQVIIGNNYGNCLKMSFVMWLDLLRNGEQILRYFTLEKDASIDPIILQNGLCVKFSTYLNKKIIQISLNEMKLYLMHNTVKFMLALEDCIGAINFWLNNNISCVNEKFSLFIKELAYKKCVSIESAYEAINQSRVFEKDKIIDCELLLFHLKTIIKCAKHM